MRRTGYVQQPLVGGVNRHAVASRGRRALANRCLTLEQASTNHTGGNKSNGAVYKPVTKPPAEVLQQWRNVDAVCFDVDCTVTVNDSLDLLAKHMGVEEQVEALTNQAMDGSMNLVDSLDERLRLINCTPADIRAFLDANPPEGRLAPNIAQLISGLRARGVQVYLLTGGFRELVLPLASYLGVPRANVLANRMNWQCDDETGLPTRLVGFDPKQPTARNGGKPAAIAKLRTMYPYTTIVMIGDGITDLEAVQTSKGADLFIGYGGVVERPPVAMASEWYVYDHTDLLDNLLSYRVAMVGSGAWASAAAKMMGENARSNSPGQQFVHEIRMFVHSDQADEINRTHENERYLPGVELPDNVVACSSLEDTVADADILVFCMPHQYVFETVKKLVGKTKPGAMAISLTKGMRVSTKGPQLISQMIRSNLNMDCSVLMGANIASEVAQEQLTEAVIGYTSLQNAEVLQKLFETAYFNITLVNDVVGVEMCGTFKNIPALGVGIAHGLGLGDNTKATLVRVGLSEMRSIAKALYPTVRDETFFESCGVGDLVATCCGGRNRMVAEEWTKCWKAGKPKTFDELETKLLNGQKLQGVLTSDEVAEILSARGWEAKYPLFTTIHRIIHGQLPPTWITRYQEGATVVLGGVSEAETDSFAPMLRNLVSQRPLLPAA